MSVTAPALATTTGRALVAPLAALAAGLLCLGLLFHEEIAAAVQVWTESTAYNHCFFIIPITLYLIWDRRETLHGVVPRPVPAAALGAIPLGLAWLVAERIGIMEGRQLIALTLAQLLFFAVFGVTLWRRLAGPLLFLYFLVPFGAFITPLLQDYTAWFIGVGLNALGIPNFTDGVTIQIPEGNFFVAEACAGLRFLIASVAFGALYALLIYRSPIRRAAFIAVSIVVPIVANGIRALGIVLLGHVLGSAEAAAADHVLYGWVFFSIVIILLLVLGLPFREDREPAPVLAPPPVRPPARAGAAVAAVAALVVLAAVGPAGAAALDRIAAARPGPAPPAIAASALCVPAPGAPAPLPMGAGIRMSATRLICDGQPVTVRIETFPPRSTAGVILGEQRRLTGIDVDITRLNVRGTPEGTWHLAEIEEPATAVASALWIDGAPAGGGLGMRLRQAQASLVGGGASAVLITVASDAAPGPGGRERSRRPVLIFLADRPTLAFELARLSERD